MNRLALLPVSEALYRQELGKLQPAIERARRETNPDKDIELALLSAGTWLGARLTAVGVTAEKIVDIVKMMMHHTIFGSPSQVHRYARRQYNRWVNLELDRLRRTDV